MYSKFINKEKRYYAETEDTVYKSLLKIYEIENRKSVIYLCSDQYLTLLVNSSYDWSEVADFAGTDLSVLKIINNKEIINKYCAENNIRIPLTMDMNEFILQQEKEFPVIIKWKEKELEARKNPIGKVLVCQTKEQFSSLLNEIEKSWVTPEILLVQTFIPGNNDYQYSVGAYYKDGKPLASVTVKQVKQYPQGISAQVYTVDDEQSNKVRQIAFGIAEKFQYTGFLEIEFKISSETGEPFLLDINPRPWGWVSILGAAYEDFYVVLEGEKPKATRKNAIWNSPIRCKLSKRNLNNVETDKRTASYVEARDIYDPNDTFPGWMIYIMAIKKKILR